MNESLEGEPRSCRGHILKDGGQLSPIPGINPARIHHDDPLDCSLRIPKRRSSNFGSSTSAIALHLYSAFCAIGFGIILALRKRTKAPGRDLLNSITRKMLRTRLIQFPIFSGNARRKPGTRQRR